MTENQESKNTFERMEQENKTADAGNSIQSSNSNELSLDDFSNTAVGDKVSYVRPNLNDTDDVVDKLQVFMPNISEDEPKLSKSGDTKYWTVSILITYSSKNADGIQNREYISGAKVFQQRDGTASEPTFWYDRCKTQAGYLWRKVADAKGIEPDRLSPREFIAYLNNKPKVKLESKEYDNYGAPKGAPEFVYKNMIKEFL
jgi:hypothetical protein